MMKKDGTIRSWLHRRAPNVFCCNTHSQTFAKNINKTLKWIKRKKEKMCFE